VASETAPELAALKQQVWDRALESEGTAYIFDSRARRMRKKLTWLTFVGLAVPLIIGALVLGFGVALKALEIAVPIAATVGIGQLVVFAWSVVAGWVDSYQRSIYAIVANRSLSEKYETLGREVPTDIVAYRHQIELLDATDRGQRDDDNRQGITDKEKAMGMRAGLRRFERRCSTCDLKPSTMDPTKCGTCGDFPKRWIA
jgi:mobilome CxxCx(11)CxxC protein